MAGHSANSPGPCPQSRIHTPDDNPSLSQASVLTNSTLSNESCCPFPIINHVHTNTRPGENTCGAGCRVVPDTVAVDSSSQDLIGIMSIPMNERTDQENGNKPNQSHPTESICAAPLEARNKKIKAPAPKAHEPKTSFARLNRTSTPILLCILAMCLLATVIIYVQSTYTAEERSRRGRPLSDLLKTDVNRTLTVLRTSQGILSALVSLALENVFVLLQWGQIHPPDGISYLNILALSPTTGALGTLGLVKSSVPKTSTKLLALSRSVSLDTRTRAGISDLIG